MSKQLICWTPDVDTADRGHFSFGSVSNTNVRELIIDCNGIDSLSIQVVWTGTLTATIAILASNSYIPLGSDAQFIAAGAASPPAAGLNARRAGTFSAITTRVTGITNPAGAGGDCIISVAVAGEPFVTHNFVKFRFTPASGTGNLDVYVSGKAVSR